MSHFDQDVFDTVICTMRVNNKRLTSSINAYRAIVGDAAHATAIGSLVPDADYDQCLEGKGLFDLADDNQALVSDPVRVLIRDNLVMLAHLRTVEYAVDPVEWEESLESFARLHNLLYVEMGAPE